MIESPAHQIRNALTYTRFLTELLAKHDDQVVQGLAQGLEKASARIVRAVEAMEAKK